MHLYIKHKIYVKDIGDLFHISSNVVVDNYTNISNILV